MKSKLRERPLLPLDLGDFVFEETGGDEEDLSEAMAKDPALRSRSFTCASTTRSGRAIALTLEISVQRVPGTSKRNKPFLEWTIRPFDLYGEYILTSTPLTFVLKRHLDSDTIEDIRIYVKRDLRGVGFGHLLLCFIKAYFFPFWVRPQGRLSAKSCHLPLGGSWSIERLSTNPSKSSLSFYKQHGFTSYAAFGPTKFLFWAEYRAIPPEVEVEVDGGKPETEAAVGPSDSDSDS
jgi:hypothetical protein